MACISCSAEKQKTQLASWVVRIWGGDDSRWLPVQPPNTRQVAVLVIIVIIRALAGHAQAQLGTKRSAAKAVWWKVQDIGLVYRNLEKRKVIRAWLALR